MSGTTNVTRLSEVGASGGGALGEMGSPFF